MADIAFRTMSPPFSGIEVMKKLDILR